MSLTKLTPEEIRGCTLLALDQPPFFPEKVKPEPFQFTIHLDGPMTYEAEIWVLIGSTVDWGDGTTEDIEPPVPGMNSVSLPTHLYGHSGTYTISIYGYVTIVKFSQEYHGGAPWGPPQECADALVSVDTPIPCWSDDVFRMLEEKTGRPVAPFINKVYLGGMFWKCHNLKSIPNHFLLAWTDPNYFEVSITAGRMFLECSSLEEIPSDLLDDVNFVSSYKYPSHESYNSVRSMFGGCSSLTSIPERLFANPKLDKTRPQATFSACSSLESIPGKIFETFTDAEIAHNVFAGCSSLTSIPQNLFITCNSLRALASGFEGCSSLISIPENLFIGCPELHNLTTCFSRCSSLVNIPSSLFSPLVLDGINRIFSYCTSLESIPDGLFSGQAALPQAIGCFYNCSSLTSVPANLFHGCGSITTFSSVFYGCSSLTEISSSAFSGCISVTSMQSAFSWCERLPSYSISIFDSMQNINNLTSTFSNCHALSYAPDLWNIYPNSRHQNTYRNCTNASNYEDIPSGWK